MKINIIWHRGLSTTVQVKLMRQLNSKPLSFAGNFRIGYLDNDATVYGKIESLCIKSAYWEVSVYLFVCCLAVLYTHMVWQPSSDRLRRSLESLRAKGEREERGVREN